MAFLKRSLLCTLHRMLLELRELEEKTAELHIILCEQQKNMSFVK